MEKILGISIFIGILTILAFADSAKARVIENPEPVIENADFTTI
jgi:hypothetical protein